MLLYELKELECDLRNSENPDMEQIAVVKSLEHLLLKIDYKYEVIPEYSLVKLITLLNELKADVLSNREIEVLKTFFNT